MANAWDERKKALEEEYFRKKEKEALAKLKEGTIKDACLGHCPKCGDVIVPMTFHGVPMDRCPGCGGIWLGPEDFKLLAAKDHRSWFERWFNHRDGDVIKEEE
jgi:Zn-finger nucleic acid-binding protein